MNHRRDKLSRGAACLALLCCVGLWTPQPATAEDAQSDIALTLRQQQWLRHHQSIRWAPEDSYAPFVFLDHDGVPDGISVDFLRLLADTLDIELTAEPATSLAGNLTRIQAHEIDLITSVKKTPQRSRYLLFTRPYFRVPAVIVVRKQQQGHLTVDDLAGKRVAVGLHYGVDTWLGQHYPDIQRVEVADDATAMTRLAFGSVDAVVVDWASASHVPQAYGIDNLRVAGRLDYTYDLRFGVRKDWPQLRDILDAALARITPAQRGAIRDRWLSLSMPGNGLSWQQRRTIVIGIAVVVLLILAIVAWNVMLRRLTRQRTQELDDELTMRKQVEERLRLSEQRWLLALEGGDSEAWDWHVATGEYLYANRLPQMSDGDVPEIESSFAQWRGLLHPDDAWHALARVQAFLNGEERHYTNEYRVSGRDGEYRWIFARGMAVERDDKGRPLRVVGIHADITERKEAQQRVEYMAMHDGLTGLPNRRLATDRFEQAVSLAQRDGHRVAMLLFDLDHFKTVNESLGHTLGDQLIVAVADRLREQLGDMDSLCRDGGDEFMVIMPRLTDLSAVDQRLQAIMQALARPFSLDGRETGITASAGAAVYPDDGRDMETLYRKVDMALHHAKASGRNIWHFFDEQMNADLTERLGIRDGLARALRNAEFELYYQPQVSLGDHSLVGVEALLRWHHPDKGMVSPARFIPIAEETGLIVPIGQWVLHEACQQAVAWQHAGLPAMNMAVNLSALQFVRGNLEQTLYDALEITGLSPIRLELEITESILISDVQAVMASLQAFKRMGIRMAIDDFGTGYSSLSYLKRLAVDKLKIDQSFIRELDDGGSSEAIVRAIIQMAHNLNLTVIAEGVENASVLAWLEAAGCDEAQGYYLGRPMPAADLFAQYGPD